MDFIKSAWDFFQNEILGMSWLNRLISGILNACGLDTTGKIGGSVLFFIYDTIKIMVLLGVLILIISYIYQKIIFQLSGSHCINIFSRGCNIRITDFLLPVKP